MDPSLWQPLRRLPPPDNEKVRGQGRGDASRSKVMTPNPAFTGPCRLRVARGGELLTQNSKSRMELICSNVRPAHPALAGEGRAAVQHAMIIYRCMSGSAMPVRSRTKQKGGRKHCHTDGGPRGELYPIL